MTRFRLRLRLSRDEWEKQCQCQYLSSTDSPDLYCKRLSGVMYQTSDVQDTLQFDCYTQCSISCYKLYAVLLKPESKGCMPRPWHSFSLSMIHAEHSISTSHCVHSSSH
eukprot:1160585-Pelagomonas_calceolata.AAC.7